MLHFRAAGRRLTIDGSACLTSGTTIDGARSSASTRDFWLVIFLPLALGPHPQRELTLMSRRGFPCPRLDMAAGAGFSLALGAPQRELTLMSRRGFPCPRLDMAAGAG